MCLVATEFVHHCWNLDFNYGIYLYYVDLLFVVVIVLKSDVFKNVDLTAAIPCNCKPGEVDNCYNSVINMART